MCFFYFDWSEEKCLFFPVRLDTLASFLVSPCFRCRLLYFTGNQRFFSYLEF